MRYSKLNGPDGRQYVDNEIPIVLAFLDSREGFSTDQLLADPDLNAAFVAACAREGAPGTPNEWNRTLLRLRKAGRLPKVDVYRRRRLTDAQIDPYSFASEIAWHCVESKRQLASLDDIFCDPAAAAEFDQIAARYAPGYAPFDYRWAALWIRKQAHKYRKSAAFSSDFGSNFRLPRISRWSQLDLNALQRSLRRLYSSGRNRKAVRWRNLDLKRRLDLNQDSIPLMARLVCPS